MTWLTLKPLSAIFWIFQGINLLEAFSSYSRYKTQFSASSKRDHAATSSLDLEDHFLDCQSYLGLEQRIQLTAYFWEVQGGIFCVSLALLRTPKVGKQKKEPEYWILLEVAEMMSEASSFGRSFWQLHEQVRELVQQNGGEQDHWDKNRLSTSKK